jgi:hypothetical protein
VAGDGRAWNGCKTPPIPQPLPKAPCDSYRDLLTRRGYVTVPTPFAEQDERRLGRKRFDKMLRESPEFRKPDHTDMKKWTPLLCVLGGFAALGNPSSFHHEFIRRVREILLHTVLVNGVLPIERGDYVEKPFDRVTIRRPGQTPTGESLHRDEAATARDKDTIFGGWLNLDDTCQTFLCAPGTHIEVGGRNKGFAKIEHPDEKSHYAKQIRSIRIPPGHMLVFYERIVHEVAPIKRVGDTSMYRVHCGFRLTKHTDPLFTKCETNKWIDEQAVPRIKSGQWPAVFPSNYTNFPNGTNLASGMKNADWLSKWSQDTFVDQVLVDKVIGGKGAWAGTKQRRVEAVMRSLSTYKLKMHASYSENERGVLFPKTQWKELHTSLSEDTVVSVNLPSDQDWDMYDASVNHCPAGGTVSKPRPVEKR